jgi:hypothetical protein
MNRTNRRPKTHEEVDTLVEAWNSLPENGVPLHTFIGWTWEEYGNWVMTNKLPSPETPATVQDEVASLSQQIGLLSAGKLLGENDPHNIERWQEYRYITAGVEDISFELIEGYVKQKLKEKEDTINDLKREMSKMILERDRADLAWKEIHDIQITVGCDYVEGLARCVRDRLHPQKPSTESRLDWIKSGADWGPQPLHPLR